mgnify:CR=1 FL=1
MDKDELRVRAEKRRKLAQVADAQDSLVAEIGTAWLQEAAMKWNPDVQPKVPAGVPVGPDFLRFVKTWMKSNKFRTLEFGEAAVKAGAEAVASWIDFNGSRVVGIDYPNPLTEINKAKGEGFMTTSSNKQTKTAQQSQGYRPGKFYILDTFDDLIVECDTKEQAERVMRYLTARNAETGEMYESLPEDITKDPEQINMLSHMIIHFNDFQREMQGKQPLQGRHHIRQTKTAQQSQGYRPGKFYILDTFDDLIVECDTKEQAERVMRYLTARNAETGEMYESLPEDITKDPEQINMLSHMIIHFNDFQREMQGKQPLQGRHHIRQTKTAESIYGPIDRESVGLYTEPEEWSRYCPEHAGVMMRRVKDGVYQCPMKGEVFSYTDGHDVEIKIGVQNQTNPNWNKTFPQKGFLDTPNQQSFEKKKHPEYKENKDTSYQEIEDLYADDKKASFKPFSKKAESLGIMDKMFAPTIRHSRYCPEHPGVSLYRIADSVFQCPLDRTIYDYEKGFTTQDGKEHSGGNIAEMTPDFPEFYQSPHPFLMKGSVKGFMKKALQPVKLEPTPEYEKKSALERFIAQTKTWGKDKPLEEAQKETLDFLQSTKINPRNKAQMMAKVQNQPNVEELVFYLWQSLLAGSGMRTSSLKVAETNLEYRIARDIDLALRGDENSKKMLGLMIDGVFKGKSMMLAAKEAYDFVEKANQPAPRTIEVQEQPTPGAPPPGFQPQSAAGQIRP